MTAAEFAKNRMQNANGMNLTYIIRQNITIIKTLILKTLNINNHRNLIIKQLKCH